MKHLLSKALWIVLVVFLFLLASTKTNASNHITVYQTPANVYANAGSVTFTFTSTTNAFVVGEDYTLGIWMPGRKPDSIITLTSQEAFTQRAQQANYFSVTINNITLGNPRATRGEWSFKLWKGGRPQFSEANTLVSGSYYVYPPCANPQSTGCPALRAVPGVYQENTQAEIEILNANNTQTYTLWFEGDKQALYSNTVTPDSTGVARVTINVGKADLRAKTLCMTMDTTRFDKVVGFPCDIHIPIVSSSRPVPTPSGTPTGVVSGPTGLPLTPTPAPGGLGTRITPTVTPQPPPLPCKYRDGKCIEVDTAIGPIGTEPQAFINRIFSLLLALAGGIALILIIYSGYQLMTSQGNPEKVQGARETITSAIVGLLFIIFSIVILEFIGVDILRLPGFSR